MKLYKDIKKAINTIDIIEQRRVSKQIKGKEINENPKDKACTLVAGILKIGIFGLIMVVVALIITNVVKGYDPLITAVSLGFVPVVQCVIAGLMALGAFAYLIYGIITIAFSKKSVEKYYMRRMQILSMNLLDIFAIGLCALLMAIMRQGTVFIITGVIMGLALISCILKFIDYGRQTKKYNSNNL